MNRYGMAIAAAALAGTVMLAGSPAWARTQAAAAGSVSAWEKAEEVPGSAALNADGLAGVASVSCASPGDCGAGGSYVDGSGHEQAMVDTQTNGIWAKAEEVPGIAALDTGGGAEITSVSCASPGNCSAGGYYGDGSGQTQAFVVTQSGGTWGNAEEVPGTAKLNTLADARIYSVSCASPGDCSAGGDYDTGTGQFQAFVVSQSGGTWGKAAEVPGTAKLNTAGQAQIYSVSCASAGNCSAGGYYAAEVDGYLSLPQAFVVTQSGGVWGKAEEVPGTAKLNSGGYAAVDSVSCASPGDCGAGGSYRDTAGNTHAFVVSQSGGTWGKAKEVPGTATLDTGGVAQVNSVSCASPGDCSAGGFYAVNSAEYQAFVVSQSGGVWGKAKEVLGIATLNHGIAEIYSLSCAAPGDCSAGGDYFDSSSHYQAFVVSQSGGAWGKAEEVPGTATLNKGGDAQISSVSCASPGECGAGGAYEDGSSHQQAFVDSQG